jgi:hypothetical protein
MALSIDTIKNGSLNTKAEGIGLDKSQAVDRTQSPLSDLISRELKALRSAETQLEQAISGTSRTGQASMRELLALQNQASRFHLKVEVASRVAEAASSTVRRLQQG